MINTKWKNYLQIYTDGSKSPEQESAAAAFFVPYYDYSLSKRLSNYTSSYRAEMAAIVLALEWLYNHPSLYTGAVIFSDSLSSLQAIKSCKDELPVYEILYLCSQLKNKRMLVYFEWIPSHCGLNGNEIVDIEAKRGLKKKIEIDNKLARYEVNSVIKKWMYVKWQKRWEGTESCLKDVQKNVKSIYICKLNNRKNKSILHCLRMGNIGLNVNLCVLKKHDTGYCPNCEGIFETITHFLCQCPEYIVQRAMLMAETGLYEEK